MRVWLAVFLTALAVTAAPKAQACEDYGCDAWGGLYSTGGYDLYQFGIDIYTTISYTDYSYDYSSWGGDCASLLSTCGGGYDYAGLYGGYGTDYSSGYYTDLLTTMCLAGYCGGSTQPSYTDTFPVTPFPGTMTPPVTPPIFPPLVPPTIPPVTTVPPYVPPTTLPPYVQPPAVLPPPALPPMVASKPPVFRDIPRDPANPYLPPPPSNPTWGGCDGVIIPCPGGPITRNPPGGNPPGGNPPGGNPPGGNPNPQNPSVHSGTPPVRNQVPRGAVGRR